MNGARQIGRVHSAFRLEIQVLRRGPSQTDRYLSSSDLGCFLTPRPLSYQACGQMRGIGVQMAIAENDPEGQARVAAFQEGLRKLAWIDCRNIQIDMR